MIKGLSLFANVGVSERYLKDLGVEIVVANELEEKRVKLYEANYPDSHAICGDITVAETKEKIISSAKEKGVDFIMATPPCQGMSVAGKQQKNDPRNLLICHSLEVMRAISPTNILIENVVGMLKTTIHVNGEDVLIIDYIKEQMPDYHVKAYVVDAADYGTPQFRKRAIITLSKKGEWPLPEKQEKITVRDAISHLPSLKAGEKSSIKWHEAKPHNENHILWMSHTASGKTALDNEHLYPEKDGRKIKAFKTTYKRIEWDKPAPTITMANGSVSSQNNVHPGRRQEDGLYSDARVLTIKELFILSGLDDFTVPDWVSDNFLRQVLGEQLPPKLLAAFIKTMLK